VDPDICAGSGMCVLEAPGSFKLEDEIARPQDPPGSEDEVLAAAAMCPTGAITVYDAETGMELR
jgi:ferredoxin